MGTHLYCPKNKTCGGTTSQTPEISSNSSFPAGEYGFCYTFKSIKTEYSPFSPRQKKQEFINHWWNDAHPSSTSRAQTPGEAKEQGWFKEYRRQNKLVFLFKLHQLWRRTFQKANFSRYTLACNPLEQRFCVFHVILFQRTYIISLESSVILLLHLNRKMGQRKNRFFPQLLFL